MPDQTFREWLGANQADVNRLSVAVKEFKSYASRRVEELQQNIQIPKRLASAVGIKISVYSNGADDDSIYHCVEYIFAMPDGLNFALNATLYPNEWIIDVCTIADTPLASIQELFSQLRFDPYSQPGPDYFVIDKLDFDTDLPEIAARMQSVIDAIAAIVKTTRRR